MRIPSSVRTLVVIFCLSGLAAFLLFAANQAFQVVSLAKSIDPRLEQPMAYSLLFLSVILLTSPLVLIFRFPRRIHPPDNLAGREGQAFIRKYGKRLRRTPIGRAEVSPEPNLEQIKRAVTLIETEAVQEMRSTANRVFISTAVSQSGRMDGLLVLMLQVHLVWRIASLYGQRPSPVELLHLYSAVAASSFSAATLEDLDLEEQLEPVLAAVLGSSAAGAVPGFGHLASFVMSCLLEGSANAFLTLRVGYSTKRYCSALTQDEIGEMDKYARRMARKSLAGVVKESSKTVASSIWTAAGSRAKNIGGWLRSRRGRTDIDSNED